MRLSLALQILLTNTVVNHAFHTPITISSFSAVSTSTTTLFSDSRLKNPEWDNDDFLNSLSGTPEQRDQVNRSYHEQAEKTRASQERMAQWRQTQEGGRSIPNIPQTSPPPQSMMTGSSLEDAQDKIMGGMAQPGDISGGSRFRNMMEQSGQKQGMVNPYPPQFHDPSEFTNNPYQQEQQPPQQYQQPPQQEQQPPPQQIQQQAPLSDPNEILNQLANQVQPQQQQQYQQAPPIMKDPNRPVGRNKDADQIANTSDMYFAQLKLDSKIRKRAFLSGDYDTSNKVFDDERVQNLPSELEKNPFIRAVTEQSKRNKDADLTTSEDEALPTTLMYTTAELNKPKYTPGLNYREKLKARQSKHQQQSPPQDTLPSNTVVSSPTIEEPKEEEVVVPPPPEVVNVVEEPVVMEEQQELPSSPPQQEYQPPPPPPPAQQVYQQPEQAQYQPPPQQYQQPLSDPNELLNQLAGVPSPNQQQQAPQFQDPNRPIGRNKDADQIANTSDMYFAQLKLDSKIRKRAFLDGDYNTSNEVFADERVQDLPSELQKNPFIRAVTDQSKRNNELTTSEDEAITNMMYTMEDVNKPKYAQGLNYREKLKARQNKEQKQVVDAPLPSPPTMESVPPPIAEQSTSEPITTSTTVTDDDYANESRGKMRLLQGLILKHKGGPGFGAGRLKAPEEARFKETANDVVSMLKSEISSSSQAQIDTPAPPATTSAPASTTTNVEVSPLVSAQIALQEAIQRCQDPSLSDLEKSQILLSAQTTLQEAASKLSGGATGVPEAAPATPPTPTVAEETKAVFSTKNDDLLKDILFKLKDASGDAKFGLKESLEKEKAQELMELLPQMRQALLEEIDMVPTTASTTPVKEPQNPEIPTEFDHETNPTGGTKFQEMLARAKAAKTNQN